jgi:hypothetical protein
VVLLKNPTIPPPLLQGSLVGQIAPYPTVIASQDGIGKHHPEFWTALDQKLKPSLNYIMTMAFLLDALPIDSAMTSVVTTVAVDADNKDNAPA